MEHAHEEYAFIKKHFCPYGRSNPGDAELMADETNEESVTTHTKTEGPNSLFI